MAVMAPGLKFIKGEGFHPLMLRHKHPWMQPWISEGMKFVSFLPRARNYLEEGENGMEIELVLGEWHVLESTAPIWQAGIVGPEEDSHRQRSLFPAPVVGAAISRSVAASIVFLTDQVLKGSFDDLSRPPRVVPTVTPQHHVCLFTWKPINGEIERGKRQREGRFIGFTVREK